MNIFLRKYLKLTLYILRKISAIDCEAFIECIKQDSLIKPKINDLNYEGMIAIILRRATINNF